MYRYSLYYSFNICAGLKIVKEKRLGENMIPSFRDILLPLKLLFISFLFFLFILMQIPVSSLRDTVLELAVFDQHRRKFDNFSSLMLEWKSSNETLAHFENYNSVKMVAKDDGSGQSWLHGTVKIYKSFHIPAKQFCTKYFLMGYALFRILSFLTICI